MTTLNLETSLREALGMPAPMYDPANIPIREYLPAGAILDTDGRAYREIESYREKPETD